MSAVRGRRRPERFAHAPVDRLASPRRRAVVADTRTSSRSCTSLPTARLSRIRPSKRRSSAAAHQATLPLVTRPARDRARARAVLHGLEDLLDVGAVVGRDAGRVGVGRQGRERERRVRDEREEGALGCRRDGVSVFMSRGRREGETLTHRRQHRQRRPMRSCRRAT